MNTYPNLKAITLSPKSGDEPFYSADRKVEFTLLDFWRWSSSDLTNNTLRGILAEYLVARAMGLNTSARTEWDAYDLITPDGLRIEVKSSAYIQSWSQTRFSIPCFSIGARRAWYAETNTYAETPCRSADVYVFALLHHKDKATINPLCLDQWTFYVMPTALLNEKFPQSKTVALSRLIGAGAKAVSYQELESAIVLSHK